MNTYVMLVRTKYNTDFTYRFSVIFFNIYHALIESVCISWWAAQKSPSCEWEIWIQQGLFVLNIPDQLIIGGMDIKLSPPSYKEKDDENAI